MGPPLNLRHVYAPLPRRRQDIIRTVGDYGWIGWLLIALFYLSPYLLVTLIPAFVLAPRFRRRLVSALVGAVSTLLTLWALSFAILAVIDIFDEIETYTDRRIAWPLWLAEWLGLLSLLMLPIGGLVGWARAGGASPAPVRQPPVRG